MRQEVRCGWWECKNEVKWRCTPGGHYHDLVRDQDKEFIYRCDMHSAPCCELYDFELIVKEVMGEVLKCEK